MKIFFLFKRVLDQGPEQRESKLTVLFPLIIIILISYIFLYYIIIKLLIMENHPSWNRKGTPFSMKKYWNWFNLSVNFKKTHFE